MPGIDYEIKTSADLKALRDTADGLRRQIMLAKASGEGFGDLQTKLNNVSTAMKSVGGWDRLKFATADMIEGISVVGNFARAINGMAGPVTLAIGALSSLVGTASRAVSEFAGAETKMAKTRWQTPAPDAGCSLHRPRLREVHRGVFLRLMVRPLPPDAFPRRGLFPASEECPGLFRRPGHPLPRPARP